jgi:hypothetical protein
MSLQRHRVQLVISLGEGFVGKISRQHLERAAKREHLLVSVWARNVLLNAAGVPTPMDEVHRRLTDLEKRIEMIENIGR